MRLIDADELIKNWYDEYIKFMTREEIESMDGVIENAPTINAIPIPKDATNGDIMKVLFPKVSSYKTRLFQNNRESIILSEDWWNTPYKQENADD